MSAEVRRVKRDIFEACVGAVIKPPSPLDNGRRRRNFMSRCRSCGDELSKMSSGRCNACRAEQTLKHARWATRMSAAAVLVGIAAFWFDPRFVASSLGVGAAVVAMLLVVRR